MLQNLKLAKRRAVLALAAASAVAPAGAQSVWTNPNSDVWTNVANWNNGVGPAPTSGATTTVTFNASGSTTYTANNNIFGVFSLNNLTFNNTGTGRITLSGNTLEFTGTTPTINATGTAQINNLFGGTSLRLTGTGTVYVEGNNSSFTGTLTIDGGKFISSNNVGGTHNFNPVSIVVNNGGTYAFGENGVGNPNIPNTTYITANTGGTVIWDEGEDFGGFILDGGTITFESGGANLNGTAPTELRSGTINVAGGTNGMAGSQTIRKTTAGTVNVIGSPLNTAAGLAIEEGTLATSGSLGSQAAATPGTITFGTAATTTGTLSYTGATGSTTRALVLNNTGGTFNVSNAATTLTVSGAVSNAAGSTGVLTKTGPGTLHLTGALNQTSTTVVNGGALRVNTGTSAGGFTVNAGGTLAVNSAAGTAAFNAPSISLTDPTSTLSIDLATTTLPTATALVNVTAANGFTPGTGTIRVTNTGVLPNGAYTLVDYTGTGITGPLNFVLPVRTAATFDYNTVDTKIVMTVTGTDTVKWNGNVSGTWDTGSAENIAGTNNFKLATAGTATNFVVGDRVTFDDTAAGPNFNIAIPATVLPATVTVNNVTNAYTFSGAAGIGGAATLTKQGAGTLFVTNDNTYSGTTTISAGTVDVGNGGTTGSLGTGTITVATGATLAFTRTSDSSIPTVLAGAGTINKTGAGTLTLLNNNSFTGTVNINAGTLLLNDTGLGGDLNAVRINVAGGAKFLFGDVGGSNPDLPSTTLIDVESTGEAEFRIGEDWGALRLKGGTLRLTGNNAGVAVSFSAAAASAFNGLAVESGTIIASNTGTGTGSIGGSATNPVTKTTAGTLTLSGPVSFTAATPITIADGTLVATAANFPATGTGALTLGGATTAATVQISGAGTMNGTRPLSIAAGGAAIEIADAGATLNQTGLVSGAGNLTKTGAGSLTMAASATFTGATTFSGGGNLRLLSGPTGVAGGAFTLGTGTSLTMVNNTTPVTFTTPGLTLASTGNTISFELNGTTNPTIPLLGVTGANLLNLNGGSHTISVSSPSPLGSGTITLIDYNGTAITSGFTLAGGIPGRGIPTLVYNTANTSIDLSIAGSDTVKWTGAVAGGVWDVGTAPGVGGTNNFQLVTAGTPTNFVPADVTLFDDTASDKTVNVSAAVAPSSLTVNTASTYTFQGTGAVTGTTGLVKQGTGTLVVATNNTNTGATMVSAGTLQIGNGGTTGAVGTGAIANEGALVINRSDAVTIPNAISGAGTLAKIGTNTVTLTGAFTQTGNISIAGGTLAINSNADTTYPGVISGAGTFSKGGTGTFTLSADQTYTGGTVINAGTLRIGNGGTTGSIGGNINIANGTLRISRSDAVAINTDISGAGGVTADGGGTLTLGGQLTYTGVTSVAAGALTINAAGDGLASSINLAANVLNINNASTYTLSGALTGTGVINKSGAGTLRLTANNNPFTGTININAGKVLLTDELGSGGDLSAASIVVNNGANFTFGSSPFFNNENPDHPVTTYITVNTGGTVDWNIGEQIGGFILNGGALTVTAINPGSGAQGNIDLAGAAATELRSGTVSAGVSVNPPLVGSAAINKTTTGTVVFSGVAIQNGGGVNIQEGILETNFDISGAGNLAFGTATTNGTLRFSGASRPMAKPVVFNAGGGTIEVGNAATVYALTGVASGVGGLTKTGPGTLSLENTNTYTGGTTVSAGTLQVGNAGTSGSIVGNVVNNGTLAFSRSDEVTFAGDISGTGGVTKLGTNTLNLTGNLTYNGTTAVNEGTLRVRAGTLGNVTVGAAATFAVNNVAAPATLATSGLALNNGGSTLRFELNSAGNPTVPLINVTGNNGLTLGGGTHTISIANSQPLTVGQFTLIDYTGTAITSGFNLAGLPARLVGAIVYDTANTEIDLNVTGVDSIVWNGNVSNIWNVGSAIDVGGTNNWRRASNGTATNFVQADQVLFDDTATATGTSLTVEFDDGVAPSTITFNNTAKNYTLQGGGTITGATSLTKSGTGSVTLLTSNSYTGTTTVNAGTLVVGNGGTTGSLGTGALVNNGAVTFNRSDDFGIDGNVSGTGTLTKQGAGVLTANGIYALEGQTTISAGKLSLASGGTFIWPGGTAGAGQLEKTGGGSIAVTGDLTHTGGTTITGGALAIGNTGTTGSISGAVTLAGGTLAFNRTDATTFTGSLSGTGTIAVLGGSPTITNLNNFSSPGTAVTSTDLISVAAGANLTLQVGTDFLTDARLSGAGTIIKTGAGRLTVTGSSNTFTGKVIINAGAFRIADSDTTAGGGDLNPTDIIVNSGGTFEFFGPEGNSDIPGGTYITVNTGGVVEFTEGEDYGGFKLAGGSYTSNVNNNVTLDTILESGTLSGIQTTNGTIASTAKVIKNTPGTVTATNFAINTTGGVAIEDGVFSTNTAFSPNFGTNPVQPIVFGTSAGVSSTRGTLEWRGANATLSLPLTLNTGGGVLAVSEAATVYTVSGQITGAGSLVKDGPGTLVLSNATNNYTGTTEFKGGTLRVGNLATLGTGASGITFSGGTLQATAALTFPGGSPARSATFVTATTGTVDTNGFDVTFQQDTTGGGSLTKSGAGTLTLAGVNGHTGGTSVTGGALVTNSTLAASVGPMSVTGTGSSLTAPRIAPSGLTIGVGASTKLTATDYVGNFTARSSAGTLANTGLLDVGSTGIVVATAVEADIRAQIKSGRNEVSGSPTWTGTTGITSSTAQLDASNRAVGYSVSGATITVAQTVLGDSNLDGLVNVLDRGTYLANVGQTGRNWQQADWNYDDIVNVLDRAIYLGHVGMSLPTPPPFGGGGAGSGSAGDALGAMSGSGSGTPMLDGPVGNPVAGNTTPGDGVPAVTYDPTTGKLMLDTDGLSNINAILLPVSPQSRFVTVVGDIDGAAGANWSQFYAGGQNWESALFTPAGNLTMGTWELATMQTGLSASVFSGGIQFILQNGNLVNTTVEVVPEPTGLALAAMAGLGLLARRRRRGA